MFVTKVKFYLYFMGWRILFSISMGLEDMVLFRGGVFVIQRSYSAGQDLAVLTLLLFGLREGSYQKVSFLI